MSGSAPYAAAIALSASMMRKAGAMNAAPASTPPGQPARSWPTKMHICMAVAPGSALTRASPSRKRSLLSQPRRSCTSAWMSGQITAAPPKLTVPILRKTLMTSNRLRIVSLMAVSSIDFHAFVFHHGDRGGRLQPAHLQRDVRAGLAAQRRQAGNLLSAAQRRVDLPERPIRRAYAEEGALLWRPGE